MTTQTNRQCRSTRKESMSKKGNTICNLCSTRTETTSITTTVKWITTRQHPLCLMTARNSTTKRRSTYHMATRKALSTKTRQNRWIRSKRWTRQKRWTNNIIKAKGAFHNNRSINNFWKMTNKKFLMRSYQMMINTTQLMTVGTLFLTSRNHSGEPLSKTITPRQ